MLKWNRTNFPIGRNFTAKAILFKQCSICAFNLITDLIPVILVLFWLHLISVSSFCVFVFPVCSSWCCLARWCTTTTSTHLRWPIVRTPLIHPSPRSLHSPHTAHTPRTHHLPHTLPLTLSTQLSPLWQGCRSPSDPATERKIPQTTGRCACGHLVVWSECLCAWINMCVCVTRVYCLMLLAHLLLRKSVRLTCLSNKYFFTSIMVVFFLPTICGHCCPVSSRKRWACIFRWTVRNWIIITGINQTTC